MLEDLFLKALQEKTQELNKSISTQNGEWIIKGFIDVYHRIYTLSDDTKIISKVLELFILPILIDFGKMNGYDVILASQQNFYPDITFVSLTTNEKYAVDIKSTYRKNNKNVNGMTLGAFTGYFRYRESLKNIVFPYGSYKMHIVLGVIYSRAELFLDRNDNSIIPIDNKTYSISDIENIRSVIRDFTFFAHPKYTIASALPGSGNTKNIGAITDIERLINGSGPFSTLGEEIYDDYWMNYLTSDMARKIGTNIPYKNLETYSIYKNKGLHISLEKAKLLDTIDIGSGIILEDE